MSDVERESLEVDILFVGAGPATLVSALHLSRQIAACNAKAEKSGGKAIEPPTILVIEKSASLGDHSLSGAVINTKAIAELMPDFMEQGFPTEYICDDASFYLFFRSFSIKSPICPPNFQKTGYHVASLSNVVKWLGAKCEEAGIEIYPGFAGDQLLVEGNRVVGVRIGDMGVDKNGKPKANYQPGMDIFAKVTVLGEGVRGSLTKQLIDRFDLQGRYPQVYETGIKEIWRVKPEKHKPGRVIHGALFPDFLSQFNGMWLYDMKDNLVSFGFVTMLDSKNPFNDPHLEAQKFKTTPFMRDLLDGAELVRYGAKALPVSGIYAQPKLYCDGALLVGDAASMCNAFRLSGIHLAMKSGMLAAETIIDALAADDFSAATLGGYTERYRNSWAHAEHMEARNFHGSTEVSPIFALGFNIPLMLITRGHGIFDPLPFSAGHTHMKKLSELPAAKRTKPVFEFDNKLTFSKEHLVQYAGSQHEVDQPSHLVVADVDLCSDVCTKEYGNPCESFCPAAVYEMMPDPEQPGRNKLFIHHENCVHCKTCDIADPYQIITWTPPQGGEGPDYTQM
ncbi:MAG: electron transfer flavoprotein-ubiquinone oxidoreductase [Deltaproteobacteria bacterium]|nr:electron transfer flavoprotein-ubiquinone oxidoreductase [Deltaproteobacteria bacterium]